MNGAKYIAAGSGVAGTAMQGIGHVSAMIDFEAARRNMVDNQLRPNKVTDSRVIAAMLAVPREKFVPDALRGVAYVDEDVAIGGGRALIEPMVLARLLQAAEIGPNDVVLEIGSATGYTAAVCARLAATVVAVESDPDLIARSGKILSELGADNVVTVAAPLARGYPQQAPYDAIVLSGAVAEVPQAILGQLAKDGRLVAVVAAPGRVPVAVLARNCDGVVSFRTLFDASIPLLPGFAREPGFAF